MKIQDGSSYGCRLNKSERRSFHIKQENIGDRIKAVRQTLQMSMESFGFKLGISKMSVSKLENGINNPSKQTILAICREFGINEEWLRTGEGDMKTVLTEEEEVAKIVNAIISEQPSSFRLKLIKYLTYMDEDELNMLEKAVAVLAGKDEETTE